MIDAIRYLFVGIALAQPAANMMPQGVDPKLCDFNKFFGDAGPPTPGEGFHCIAIYISNLTFLVIGFTASAALMGLIINGYRYMIGPAIPGGSSDAAKKGITMSLVGLAVSLLTYIILDTIVSSVTQ